MHDLESSQTQSKMCAKIGVRKEQILDTTENEYTYKINWGHSSMATGMRHGVDNGDQEKKG